MVGIVSRTHSLWQSLFTDGIVPIVLLAGEQTDTAGHPDVLSTEGRLCDDQDIVCRQELDTNSVQALTYLHHDRFIFTLRRIFTALSGLRKTICFRICSSPKIPVG